MRSFNSIVLSIWAVILILVSLFVAGYPDNKAQCIDNTQEGTTAVSEHTEEITQEEITLSDPVEVQIDPNNYIYPFNTMSADWGSELYEDGFRYYQIPQEYTNEGGCFPEVVQAYLWYQCEERDIDYYVLVALIERESGYHWDATGDSGESKGYMQIKEKYHTKRMGVENVRDLHNPYGNIRVGLNFLQELLNKGDSKDYHYALMSYNLGESKCRSYNNEGIYSTQYSRGILKRAQEIKQELQG